MYVTDQDYMKRAIELAKNTGMNGHIAKPLDMNKLNDVLESWL